MPRNGSGVYELPPGNPVVTGTVIRSAWANDTMTDLGTALTQSLSRDGQTIPTNNLPMGGFHLSNVGKAIALTQYTRADQTQLNELCVLTSPAMPSANNYTALLPFGATIFSVGQLAVFVPPASNTSLATININGGGVKAIKRSNGDDLQANDLLINNPTLLIWTGVNWHLVGSAAASSGGGGTAGVETWNGRSGTVTMTAQDVDNALGYVPLNPGAASNTLTGPLYLPAAAPTLSTQAVNKSYVDTHPGAAGIVQAITTSTPQTLKVDNANPARPDISTHTNIANGLVQLDNAGKIPPSLLNLDTLDYLGVWSAAAGVLPSDPTTGASYYIISEPGTLSLYVLVGTVYAQQPTPVQDGDEIIWQPVAATGRPVGWYFVSRGGASVVASQVSITPTPTFPGATNVQEWVDAADPAIAGKLSLGGGTMTGAITLAAAPALDMQAANKKYVDDLAAAGTSGVVSWNTRSGVVTMLSTDVTTALGYTPVSSAGATFTGPVHLPATNPTTDTEATSKGYVDAKVGQAAGGLTSVASNQPDMVSVSNTATTATLTVHANVALGVVQLDGSGKIPANLVDISGFTYEGEWDASGGTTPPTAGLPNGAFYVIVVGGTLTLYRPSTPPQFTPQPVAVEIGDDILLRVGSTDPNQPDGWYYLKRSQIPQTAAQTASTPTTLAPLAYDVQSWMNTIDPVLQNALPVSGGTMTGPLTLQANALANLQAVPLQQVNSLIAALNVGVVTFNGRQGAVALTANDVDNALGYTPYSTAGGPIDGVVSISEYVSVAQWVDAQRFNIEPYVSTVNGGIAIDLTRQSQVLKLGGATTITSATGLPQGNICRLTFTQTDLGLTVPGYWNWPGPTFAPPDFAAGPLKTAIIVIENDGTELLCNAVVY